MNDAPGHIQLLPTPKGCICPKGCEETCQRSDCGRKDWNWRQVQAKAREDMRTITGLNRLPGDGGLCKDCHNPADLCECKEAGWITD